MASIFDRISFKTFAETIAEFCGVSPDDVNVETAIGTIESDPMNILDMRLRLEEKFNFSISDEVWSFPWGVSNTTVGFLFDSICYPDLIICN